MTPHCARSLQGTPCGENKGRDIGTTLDRRLSSHTGSPGVGWRPGSPQSSQKTQSRVRGGMPEQATGAPSASLWISPSSPRALLQGHALPAAAPPTSRSLPSPSLSAQPGLGHALGLHLPHLRVSGEPAAQVLRPRGFADPLPPSGAAAAWRLPGRQGWGRSSAPVSCFWPRPSLSWESGSSSLHPAGAPLALVQPASQDLFLLSPRPRPPPPSPRCAG